jgi:ABC-2 type transport system ATP-binding protein
MSQKLQFVTTVLHNPKLIILDEPFSGLDPLNANLIKDEIFQLAKSGSTIKISTQRMEQVEEICNHIILLNKGKKILDGAVSKVKQDYKENLYRVGANTGHGSLETSLFSVIRQQPDEIIVKLQDGTSNNEVLEYFIRQNIQVNAFNEVLPSLNDIFIKLVEGTPAARQFAANAN